MNTTARAETVRLYGWAPWEEAARPVRALLFGEMVRRATPVMQHYQSDLFHDAMWIEEHVNGTCTFDWLIRPCGTNLSDNPDPARNDAHIGVKIGAGNGAVFYRVEIIEERGLWSAVFTDVPLDQVEVSS